MTSITIIGLVPLSRSTVTSNIQWMFQLHPIASNYIQYKQQKRFPRLTVFVWNQNLPFCLRNTSRFLDGDFEDDVCSKSQAKIRTGKIRNSINEIKGLISLWWNSSAFSFSFNGKHNFFGGNEQLKLFLRHRDQDWATGKIFKISRLVCLTKKVTFIKAHLSL